MTDKLSSTQCRNETLLEADGIRARDAGPRPKRVPVKTIPSWTKADPRWCNIDTVVNPIIIDEALSKVIANRGSGGVDHISTSELRDYWLKYGETIRQKIVQGTYIPLPVKRVDIPKPNGGKRMLGIPSVIDRVIQQALVNVLEPVFDSQFSEFSYGFRKGRNAHQAVLQAQSYVKNGNKWVVELDLSKFFDRVNHDILMNRVARVVEDKKILKLIRRYLNAGIMEDGIVKPRSEGVPQGGPLSPLLSNIILTELDRELENRGHKFCRYADDCNIYVKSEEAAKRVLESVTNYLEGALKLRVNRDKSGTFRPYESVFLGYSFHRGDHTRVIVAEKSVKRLKKKLKTIYRQSRGTSLSTAIRRLTQILRGWRNYFKLDTRKGYFEKLDINIRTHLRVLIWRAWKKPRTRERELRKRGLDAQNARKSANNGRGPWHNARALHMRITFPNALFTRLGLYNLSSMGIV